jgi:predicted ABC-class ATPase
MNLSALMQSLQQAFSRLGLVGAMGLVLLGACAWAQWSWLPVRQAQADRLASDARYLRHSLQEQAQASNTAAAGPNKAISSPDQAWQALWVQLPKAERRVALQGAVLKSAKDQGVQVQSVQYQGQRQNWADQGSETLWRQRMTMPVQGRYTAVRDWIQQLLREPALSVDGLSIQRDNVQVDAVVAQVSVSLWWRQSLPAGPVAQGAQP